MVTLLFEDQLETVGLVPRELDKLAGFVFYELNESTCFVLKGGGVKRENSKSFGKVEELHGCV